MSTYEELDFIDPVDGWVDDDVEADEAKEDKHIPDSHLDSPIRGDTAFKIVQGLKVPAYIETQASRGERFLRRERREWSTSIHKLIAIIWSMTKIVSPVKNEEFSEPLELARKMLGVFPFTHEGISGDIRDYGSALDDLPVMIVSRRLRQCEALTRWLNNTNSIRIAELVYNGANMELKFYKLTEGNLAICFLQDLAWIEAYKQLYILDVDALMMIIDVVQQRTLALTMATINKHLKVPRYLEEDRILSVYTIFDNWLLRNVMDPYKLIKLWEPLVSGRLQTLGDEIRLEEHSFWDEMVRTAYEVELEQGQSRNITDSLVKALEGITLPDHLSELKGLHRHWGHPFVFLDLAIERNKEKGGCFKEPSKKSMSQVTRMFKKILFVNYFKKNKLHLRCDVSRLRRRHPRSEIIRALELSEPLNEFAPQYRLQDWDSVTIENSVDITDDLNILDPIGDKASSPTLKLFKARLDGAKIPWQARRSLAVFLASEIFDPVDFLAKIDEHGISPDDLVIGLIEKERELGSTPRTFSIMTLVLKLYFGLTESLIAKHLIPYFPQCTMTDSHALLMTKKMKLAAEASRNKRVMTIFFNIDFSKWNLQFRSTSTKPLFEIMDRFLGYENLITRTHSLFAQCLHYCIREDIPREALYDRISGTYAYYGNLGGNEGLRQKGWTLITGAVLNCVMELLGYNFDLIGQGDNQVLAVYVPVPGGDRTCMSDEQKEILRGKLKKIKESMNDFCTEFGLPLKLEETWVSHALLDYGKDMFFMGRQLPMSYKRVCRMMMLVNQDYPGLDSAITSIIAAAQAGMNQGCNLVPMYVLSVLVAYKTFFWHYRYSLLVSGGLRKGILNLSEYEKRQAKLTRAGMSLLLEEKKLVFAILLGCNTLGGSSFATPYDYLARGERDSLTQHITYLLGMLANPRLTEGERNIVRNLLYPTFSRDPDILLLIENPYSLCLERNTTIANIQKQYAMELLKSGFVKNPLIKEVQKSFINDRAKVAALLGSVDPLAALQIHDFYKGTLPGFAEDCSTRFAGTRTMNRAVRLDGVRAFERLVRAEMLCLCSWVYNLTTISCDSDMRTCPLRPVTMSLLWRKKSWGKDVHGVTIPPLVSFIRRYRVCHVCPQPDNEPYIRVIYASTSCNSRETVFSERGPLFPYMGGETKEKVSGAKEYEYRSIPTLINACIRNLRAVGWVCEEGGNLCVLLERALESFSNVSPHYFKSVGGITGSFEHRWSSLGNVSGAFISVPPTLATHIKISSNTMAWLSRGSGNYPLHFQQLFCDIIHIESITRLLYGDLSSEVHYHLVDPSALFELDARTIEAKLPPPVLTKLSTNSPLYIDKTRIEKKITKTFTFRGKTEQIEGLSENIKYALLAREACRSLQGESGRISMAWVFEADINKVFANIRSQGIIMERASMLKGLRHMDMQGTIFRTGNGKLLTVEEVRRMSFAEKSNSGLKALIDSAHLEKNFVARITFASPGRFRPLTSLLSCSEIIHQVFKDDSYVDAVPAAFPARDNDILNMIKTLIETPKEGELREIQLVFAQDEFIPLDLYLYLVACTLEGHDYVEYETQQVINRVRKRITKVMVSKLGLDPDDILAIHCQESGALEDGETAQLRFIRQGLRKIYEVAIFVRATKDYLAKQIQYEPRTTVLQSGIRAVPVSYPSMRLPVLRGAPAEMNKFERQEGQFSAVRKLPSSHGAFLYALLAKEDDITDILMVGDGAGSTSLGVSSRFPECRLKIIPFLAEADFNEEYLEFGPPTLVVHNPMAKYEVIRGVPLDLNSDSIQYMPASLQYSSVLCDLVPFGIDVVRWVRKIVAISTEKRLFLFKLNGSSDYIDNVLFLLGSYIENPPEVRAVKMGGVVGHLIICDIKGLRNTRSYILAKDDVSVLEYQEVERQLMREIKQDIRSLTGIIAWLKCESPQSAYLDLSFNFGRFYLNARGLADVDIFRRASGFSLPEASLLMFYFMHCYFGGQGTHQERVDSVYPEGTFVIFWLKTRYVVGSLQGIISQEEIRSVVGRNSRIYHVRKWTINRYPLDRCVRALELLEYREEVRPTDEIPIELIYEYDSIMNRLTECNLREDLLIEPADE